MIKRKLLVVALVTNAIFSGNVFAADEYNVGPGLTLEGKPLALHGADPVAFIDLNNRLVGSPKYTGTYNGVAYYFASKENLDTFMKAPDKYTPEFGGFCAFGASVGKKFDGNPRFAAVEDGKLYVFINETVLKEFYKDKQGTIAKANKNWREIRSIAAEKL